MIYHSLAEIYAALDDAHRDLRERVAPLGEERQNFRPAAEAWSIAEIVEHLAIIESRVTGLLGMIVAKAEQEGSVAAEFKIVSLARFAERGAGKLSAPDAVRPQGGASVAQSLAKMDETRAAIGALQARLNAVDVSAFSYPHPLFGPLNAYEWLATLAAHERRHLKQIEAIVAAPDFPRD